MYRMQKGTVIQLPELIYLNGKEMIRADETPKFPPVVAQHMISYAINDKYPIAVYDPFVGQGTMLIVAAMNFPGRITELHGLDANQEAVTASQLNLELVKEDYAPSWEIRHGDALKTPLPKTDSPLVVVTDPPFGRATKWTNEEGQETPQSLLPEFLEHMAGQKPHRLIFCYDKNPNIIDQIRPFFKIQDIEIFKDRKIYSLQNK